MDALRNFGKALVDGGLLRKTAGSHHNFMKLMFDWIESNEIDSGSWTYQTKIAYNFSRETDCERSNAISKSELGAIYRACLKDIDVITMNFRLGVRISNGEDLPIPDLTLKEYNALVSVLRVRKQKVGDVALCDSPQPKRLDNKSIVRTKRFQELSTENMLPLYLILILKSAANPDGIRNLLLDCIEENATDSESIFFKWDKGRSNREQKILSPKKGRSSIFALVSLIKEMTSHTRGLADEYESKYLFITQKNSGVSRVSVQSLHDRLAEFRVRHGLNFFCFSDIRKAIANMVHAKTSSLSAVQGVLQHKDVRTSKIYLDERAGESNFERLHKFQGDLISLASAKTKSDNATMLGLTCKNPLEGIAPKSKKGEICLEFLKCASCPNALVIKDDALNVARIIRARDSLEEMKAESTLHTDALDRYMNIYEPILNIIKKQILPKVGKQIITKASEIAKSLSPLPRMY